MQYTRLLGGALPVVLLSLTACAGTVDRRVDPESPDAVGGANLRSYDIEQVADQMARSLIASGELRSPDPASRISLYVLPLVNESSDTINTSLLSTTVRTQLVKAMGRRVKVLDRSAEQLAATRRERLAKREGAVSSDPDRLGQVAGADYVLKGRIQDRQLQGRDLRSAYYVVTFELSDLETTELIWVDDYRVKFESNKSVISR